MKKQKGFFLLPLALIFIIFAAIGRQLTKAAPARGAQKLFHSLKLRQKARWAQKMALLVKADRVRYESDGLFLCRLPLEKGTLAIAGAQNKDNHFITAEYRYKKEREKLTLRSRGSWSMKEVSEELIARSINAHNNRQTLRHVKKEEMAELIPSTLRKKALVRKHLTRAFENLQKELYLPVSAGGASCPPPFGGGGEAPVPPS